MYFPLYFGCASAKGYWDRGWVGGVSVVYWSVVLAFSAFSF